MIRPGNTLLTHSITLYVLLALTSAKQLVILDRKQRYMRAPILRDIEQRAHCNELGALPVSHGLDV